jgi:hypothetical protein
MPKFKVRILEISLRILSTPAPGWEANRGSYFGSLASYFGPFVIRLQFPSRGLSVPICFTTFTFLGFINLTRIGFTFSGFNL